MKELKERLTWEIPAAVKEVEQTLTELQPQLRDLTENPRECKLFSYQVQKDPGQFGVPFRYSAPHPHTLAVDFGTGGSYLALDSNSLLCIGGEPASASVYRLDLTSLLLTPQPTLPAPREGTGVISMASTVYVFGGCNAQGYDQKTSWKWTLDDSQWKSLSNMHHSRSFFTPCFYHFQIYLFASSNDKGMETFSPVTEAYSDLSINWPSPTYTADSVTFTEGEELCLVSYGGQMARWRLGESQVRLEKTNKGCASPQQAVVVGELVLIAFQGQVLRFSLDSHSFLDEK